MDKLNWDLRQICNRNKDGAFGTQAARWRSLDLMARELRALGFHNLRAGSLKPRHIEALLTRWQAAGLARCQVPDETSAPACFAYGSPS